MFARGSVNVQVVAHIGMPITASPFLSHLDGTIDFALKGGLTYDARLSAQAAKSQILATISGQKLVLSAGGNVLKLSRVIVDTRQQFADT